MRFEERITILCAQALAAHDDVEVRQILTELRLSLHQHIEQLRSGLLVAYSSLRRPNPHAPNLGVTPPEPAADTREAKHMPPRTWRQVVREIAHETDHGKATLLCQELNQLLQSHSEPPGHC